MTALQSFLSALGFFTRLPLPRLKASMPLAQSAWTFPLAGVVIGALTACAYSALLWLGIRTGIAAWLALGFQMALTGGLHEDGLADTADGLAHGRSREEKLAILRDSRIGSYGVLALIIVLAVRAEAMTALAYHGRMLWIMIAAGAGSRAGLAVLMHMLPHARSDGLAANAGKVSRNQAVAAGTIGIALLWLTGHPLSGLLAASLACLIVGRVTCRQFGGTTGDTLGAAQQVSEAMLLVILTIK
ncbi:MAG: adenosylcobinamide-GDP ribazoletransferase [Pseudomonadota bacterium]|nr:adenosylcobinamide-GDP ribazoletransferase [Pseudomonadota bacterium]